MNIKSAGPGQEGRIWKPHQHPVTHNVSLFQHKPWCHHIEQACHLSLRCPHHPDERKVKVEQRLVMRQRRVRTVQHLRASLSDVLISLAGSASGLSSIIAPDNNFPVLMRPKLKTQISEGHLLSASSHTSRTGGSTGPYRSREEWEMFEIQNETTTDVSSLSNSRNKVKRAADGVRSLENQGVPTQKYTEIN